MKKTVCMFLALCMVLALCSCNQKPAVKQPGTSTTESEVPFLHMMIGETFLEDWSEDGTNVCVKWEQLMLSEESAKEYPNLKTAFDAFNDEEISLAESTFEDLQGMVAELREYRDESVSLESDSKLYIQRADANLVSFLEYGYVYSGGAHPNHYYLGYHYDPATGAQLELTDVLTDVDCLAEILCEKLSKKYPDGIFWADSLQTVLEEYSTESFQWTMDYQGITFWFSPYDIAAYAAGPLSAKIYFAEEPKLFCEPYTDAPENHAVMLPKWLKLDFDLTEDDGKTDYVEIYNELDYYGSYNMFAVAVNDERYTDEINYAYEFEPYLVHISGQNYIYYISHTDGDYHMMSGVDINGTPEQIVQLSDTQPDYQYVETAYNDGMVYTEVINNPDHFSLATNFQLLGTRGAVADYQIDENGFLQKKDDHYTFTYGMDLTSAIPLEMTDCTNGQTTELPAGTVFTPLITDGETWVELLTKDGNVYRVTVDVSDWPYTMNGIPEEECFTDIMYAG